MYNWLFTVAPGKFRVSCVSNYLNCHSRKLHLTVVCGSDSRMLHVLWILGKLIADMQFCTQFTKAYMANMCFVWVIVDNCLLIACIHIHNHTHPTTYTPTHPHTDTHRHTHTHTPNRQMDGVIHHLLTILRGYVGYVRKCYDRLNDHTCWCAELVLALNICITSSSPGE